MLGFNKNDAAPMDLITQTEESSWFSTPRFWVVASESLSSEKQQTKINNDWLL